MDLPDAQRVSADLCEVNKTEDSEDRRRQNSRNFRFNVNKNNASSGRERNPYLDGSNLNDIPDVVANQNLEEIIKIPNTEDFNGSGLEDIPDLSIDVEVEQIGEASLINNIPSSPIYNTTTTSNSSNFSNSTSSNFNESELTTSVDNTTPTEESITETKIILLHHQYFQADANSTTSTTSTSTKVETTTEKSDIRLSTLDAVLQTPKLEEIIPSGRSKSSRMSTKNIHLGFFVIYHLIHLR